MKILNGEYTHFFRSEREKKKKERTMNTQFGLGYSYKRHTMH